MLTQSRKNWQDGRPPLSNANASDPDAAAASFALDPDIMAAIAKIDTEKMTQYRLARFRAEMIKRDIGAAILSDPLNVLYVTNMQNMSQWCLHAPGKYAFVAAQGPVILFDYSSTMAGRLADLPQRAGKPHFATIAEYRPSTPWFYFMGGDRGEEFAQRWAAELADLVRQYGGGNKHVAVDKCDPMGSDALRHHGLILHDGQELSEQARIIKSPIEIACIDIAVAVADRGIANMRAALRPGMTENQIWSHLHTTNIAHGGGWIECRLLAAGSRTNPWYHECDHSVINAGDIVAFDTDMVGPFSYMADISRSFVCPGQKVTAAQQNLYDLSIEQIHYNIDLIKPGLSFLEFAQKSWPVPEKYYPQRYTTLVHGVGMVDEYPSISFAPDFPDWGYDGHFQAGMVVSVESYLGEVGGAFGIKLEEQILITAQGNRVMSHAPLVGGLSLA